MGTANESISEHAACYAALYAIRNETRLWRAPKDASANSVLYLPVEVVIACKFFGLRGEAVLRGCPREEVGRVHHDGIALVNGERRFLKAARFKSGAIGEISFDERRPKKGVGAASAQACVSTKGTTSGGHAVEFKHEQRACEVVPRVALPAESCVEGIEALLVLKACECDCPGISSAELVCGIELDETLARFAGVLVAGGLEPRASDGA